MALMIVAEVRSAYARFGAQSERVSLLRDVALERAQQALLQAQSSYRTGMMPFASVIQDQRMLAELRMSLVGAEAERCAAYIALMRSVARDLGRGVAR
jgi:outer membrane protein TolC